MVTDGITAPAGGQLELGLGWTDATAGAPNAAEEVAATILWFHTPDGDCPELD